jgi:hypothetical protein
MGKMTPDELETFIDEVRDLCESRDVTYIMLVGMHTDDELFVAPIGGLQPESARIGEIVATKLESEYNRIMSEEATT